MLLQAGADPNARNGRDETPLHWAWAYEDQGEGQNLVQFLVDAGADPEALENSRKRPQYYQRHELESARAERIQRGEGRGQFVGVGAFFLVVGTVLLGIPLAAFFIDWRTMLTAAGIGAVVGFLLYLLSRIDLESRTLTYRVDQSGRKTLINIGEWQPAGSEFLGELGGSILGGAGVAMLGTSFYVVWVWFG